MDIGIGLPNAIPDTDGGRLLDFAARAEEQGFAAVATIDRVAYPSLDPLATLAAVAGHTTRIRLVTDILLVPLYPPVLLARAAASVDRLSGGRLTLGVGVGAREEDFSLVDRPFHRRGRDTEAALELMRRAWAGEPLDPAVHPVGPRPPAGAVPVLVGGASDRTPARVARFGAGWAASGGFPDEQIPPFLDRVRAEWRAAGRTGEPRVALLRYFVLGGEHDETARSNLVHYYGPQFGPAVADRVLRTEAQVRDALDRYAHLAVTEPYLFPAVSEVDQVDRLADVALGGAR